MGFLQHATELRYGARQTSSPYLGGRRQTSNCLAPPGLPPHHGLARTGCGRMTLLQYICATTGQSHRPSHTSVGCVFAPSVKGTKPASSLSSFAVVADLVSPD